MNVITLPTCWGVIKRLIKRPSSIAIGIVRRHGYDYADMTDLGILQPRAGEELPFFFQSYYADGITRNRSSSLWSIGRISAVLERLRTIFLVSSVSVSLGFM